MATYTEDQAAERAASTAKWQEAMRQWNIRAEIEANGGPPAGPKPAYEGASNLIEPNSATNVAGQHVGTSQDPNRLGMETETGFSGGKRPAQHLVDPSSGAAPPGGAVPVPLAPDRTLNPTQLNTGQSDQIRAGQLSYLKALEDRAAGRGPSVAGAQYALAQGDIARTNLGLAAQARGIDAAAARRQAMVNIGDQTQRAGLGQALLRAQEQTAASDQLGAALASTRGQDIGVAGVNAGLAADAGKTSFLEGGVNDRFRTGLATGVNESAAERASREYIAKYGADRQQGNTILGGLINAGGTFGSALLNYYLNQGKPPVAA